MGWMEFVADLVGSLAWPAAVLVAGLLLREPIRAVVRNTQNAPLRRAKVAGVEIEFGDVLAPAIADAAEIAQEPRVALAKLTEEDVDYADLNDLLELSPRAAVLEGFARIEKALRDLGAPDEGVDLRHPQRTSVLALAPFAHRDGLISRATADAIRRLWQIRSLVAHGATTVPPDEAAEFISVARTVLLALQAAMDLKAAGGGGQP